MSGISIRDQQQNPLEWNFSFVCVKMLFLESSFELGNRLIEFEPQIPTSVFHFTVVQVGAFMKMAFLIVKIFM